MTIPEDAVIPVDKLKKYLLALGPGTTSRSSWRRRGSRRTTPTI